MKNNKLIVSMDVYGNMFWKLNGKLHRVDGPAYEYADGYREWYLNGKQHREDGPAIDYASGLREWYINGKRHRVDGPAVENADGGRKWYLNGNNLTEEQFNREVSKMSGGTNEK